MSTPTRTITGSVTSPHSDLPEAADGGPVHDVAATRARPAGRDRYIDSLRCLALFRVVAYHTLGWAWLPLVFPSMGIMFALAGSLVAVSLDRCDRDYRRVLRKRVTRLLPPVWMFGLVVVPVMLWRGWTSTPDAGSPLEWSTLLFWALPLSDPPGSEFGANWVLPLWYIRTYLWFLLLSPATLWLFRRWPIVMLLTGPAVLLGYSSSLLELNDRPGEVVVSLATFGSCWLLGYAHHDGLIRRLEAWKVALTAIVLGGLGLGYGLANPDPDVGFVIGDLPMANMLYSFAAVLILLRWYPDFSWMARVGWLDRLVTAVNRRAMTIYLWGNVAIIVSLELLSRWAPVPELADPLATGSGQVTVLAGAWVVLTGCVLLFGWVEDLAARRPVRVNPWRSAPVGRHRAARGRLSIAATSLTMADSPAAT